MKGIWLKLYVFAAVFLLGSAALNIYKTGFSIKNIGDVVIAIGLSLVLFRNENRQLRVLPAIVILIGCGFRIIAYW
mgnify:CR=1 FL=1